MEQAAQLAQKRNLLRAQFGVAETARELRLSDAERLLNLQTLAPFLLKREQVALTFFIQQKVFIGETHLGGHYGAHLFVLARELVAADFIDKYQPAVYRSG